MHNNYGHYNNIKMKIIIIVISVISTSALPPATQTATQNCPFLAQLLAFKAKNLTTIFKDLQKIVTYASQRQISHKKQNLSPKNLNHLSWQSTLRHKVKKSV